MNKPEPPIKTPTPPPATEGLTPLDQDRASSVADEGGTSAAILEAQEAPAPVTPEPTGSRQKPSGRSA